MSSAGAQKVERHIELCQRFGIPVCNLVDEPGFMIGLEAEAAATIRHGTSTAMAAALCTVPWATVVVRKMFGVAATCHLGMEGFTKYRLNYQIWTHNPRFHSLGMVIPEGLLLTWPSAELGPLPVEGGVEVAFGKQIAASEDPEATRRMLEEQLAKRFSPFTVAENFQAHEMIDPAETRRALCEWAALQL